MLIQGKYNEKKLIEKAKAGNEKAFEEVMKHYLQDVYNFIRFKMDDDTLVEDILQEVMLGAYQSIKQFNEEASIKTWLMAITRRKIADYYRHKYADNRIEEVPIGEKQYKEEVGMSKLDQMSLMEIINTLPKEDKELIYLAIIQQLSYPEIEKMTGIPVGTVKSRMHYIKTKLKPQLEGNWRSLYE